MVSARRRGAARARRWPGPVAVRRPGRGSAVRGRPGTRTACGTAVARWSTWFRATGGAGPRLSGGPAGRGTPAGPAPSPGGPPAGRVAPGWGSSGESGAGGQARSEEHTSELQSQFHLVCRLLLEKKKKKPLRYQIPIKNKKTI